MESHRPVGVRVLSQEAVTCQKSLEASDGLVGQATIENKQLMPTICIVQVEPEPVQKNVIQWNRPHQSALAFDGKDVFFERFGCNRGVDSEALWIWSAA